MQSDFPADALRNYKRACNVSTESVETDLPHRTYDLPASYPRMEPCPRAAGSLHGSGAALPEEVPVPETPFFKAAGQELIRVLVLVFSLFTGVFTLLCGMWFYEVTKVILQVSNI